MLKKLSLLLILVGSLFNTAAKDLHELQQDFVDLKFGLFVHFGLGTYLDHDWADPEQPATLFNPDKLDCRQWIKGAESAGMNFGCMSVKHHVGFCMWDTQTTPYNVMNSSVKRDVVKEFVDASREKDMKVMFQFSILDLHEGVLPNQIKPEHTDYLKSPLEELHTSYGPIDALMIDGWDAPWSRISYEEINFQEIYDYIKSIQPDCLVMDLNGAKYPADALFYSDLKTYEQGAGQRIDNAKAWLPSMACDHLQPTWFWNSAFPTMELPSAEKIIEENIIPKNNAGCTFILNVAPNTSGLLDDNAMQRLAEIGKKWKDNGKQVLIEEAPAPIIATNLAKYRPAGGSWSDDMNIHDLATDDSFGSSWVSNSAIKNPRLAVMLDGSRTFNAVVITEAPYSHIKNYTVQYLNNGEWKDIFSGDAPTPRRVKIHRFPAVTGDAVRVLFHDWDGQVAISELGVYNETNI